MSETPRYVDPSSGAAPQPGGYVTGGAFSVPQGMAALEPVEETEHPDLTKPQVVEVDPAAVEAAAAAQADANKDDKGGDDSGKVAAVPNATPDDINGPTDKAVELQAFQPGGDPEPSGGEDSPAAQETAGDAPVEATEHPDDQAAAQSDGAQGGDYEELLNETLGPIKDYMTEHPDEVEAIQAAEAKGKNRAGITGFVATPTS